ncbi:uncharacterized protein LOC108676611 [Hyalella azteca]|uniref:Uncharacterized protein LOC108676611 n=1 Tax=Hyalella azteca TaxID=294128 RepID=A0A8B7P274_HYAAZ|nr:uncharacterized protein LOC108676611 [Hyalella azteca]
MSQAVNNVRAAAASVVFLLALQEVLSKPTHENSTVQCKKYVHTIYFVCHVTVFHLGELPAVEELDNNERSRRALQPLLCPCPPGTLSWLCPSAVYEALEHFQHNALCDVHSLNNNSTDGINVVENALEI